MPERAEQRSSELALCTGSHKQPVASDVDETGRCGACGRSFALRRDGTLRSHKRFIPCHRWWGENRACVRGDLHDGPCDVQPIPLGPET